MDEVTCEELAAMTDQELLAYEREHHGDLYMSLLRAKGMQRVALQFWHVGAARMKAQREAEAEARRCLLQKLFPSDAPNETTGVVKPRDCSCANAIFDRQQYT
jgi:hypothetical protein